MLGSLPDPLTERLLDSAAIGVAVADARRNDAPLVYVNRAFEVITGYAAEEVMGRNCRFLQTEQTDRSTLDRIRRRLEGGEESTEVLLNRRKDGGVFWNELRISPLRNEAGEVTHFVGFQTDVSERVIATKEAERLAAYNELLLESTGDGIYNIDRAGVCVFINGAAARMLGYERGQVLGNNAHKLLHHSHADGSPYAVEDCPVYNAFATGIGVRVEDEVFWHADGHAVPVEYSSFPVAEKGEIAGAVIVFTDVTHRREADAALRAALTATEEATRAKSTFMSNMSHELRTPLNAVIGYAELAAEKAEDIQAAELIPDLVKIQTAGHLLLSLINQVLDIARIEAGRMELDISTFELVELVEDAVSTVRPAAEAGGNTLRIDVEPGLGAIQTDRGKLTQVLLNVLSNAIKFTDHGLIRVAVGRRAEAVVIEVADDGIGMSADQLDRVFDPFVQADVSTTRRFGGSGLGLAICRSFCQLMGGSIMAQSSPGRGSCFRVTVLVDARLLRPPPQAGGDAATPARTPAPDHGPPRDVVVVIDDNGVDRDLLTRHLEPNGFSVHAVAQGDEGIAAARALRPVAILVDVMMPGRSGWEILRLLKSDPELCDIPVVMVTVVNERSLGVALGAAEYLTKPVDWKRLASVLDRYRTEAGSLVIVDELAESAASLTEVIEGAGWRVTVVADPGAALDAAAILPVQLILLNLHPGLSTGLSLVSRLRSRPETARVPLMILGGDELTDVERAELSDDAVHLLDGDSQEWLTDLPKLVHELVTPSAHPRPEE